MTSTDELLPPSVVRHVLDERARQEQLRRDGKFHATCATLGPEAMTTFECFTVLGEEVGEVARAVLEYSSPKADTHVTKQRLYQELIQVAAVSLAWASRLRDDS